MQELTPTVSPREYATRLGCKVERVLGWLKRGELTGINTSDCQSRPRWRISLDAIEKFEAGRSSRPPAPKPKRRKRQQNFIEFY
jgi:hypothetical protein